MFTFSVLLRGFAPPWMRRSKSSCLWIWTWWWGAATVLTSSSSMAPSSERSSPNDSLRISRLLSFYGKMNFRIKPACFYLFQGDCWICMELMSTSLDKFYKYVYCSLDDVIPEEILGKITLAVSTCIMFAPYVLHVFVCRVSKNNQKCFVVILNRPLKHWTT